MASESVYEQILATYFWGHYFLKALNLAWRKKKLKRCYDNFVLSKHIVPKNKNQIF